MPLRSGAGAALMPDMQQGSTAREGLCRTRQRNRLPNSMPSCSGCCLRQTCAAVLSLDGVICRSRQLEHQRGPMPFRSGSADLVNSGSCEIPCRFALAVAVSRARRAARFYGTGESSSDLVNSGTGEIPCRLALAKLLSCQSCSAFLSLE
jgi:hypothetical protein